jgi:predicted permease
MLTDLRYALRALRRSPGFAVVAVATLALGIGANTAVFSVVQAVLLKPLPYRGADRLVVAGTSVPDYRDVAAAVRAFEASSLWASNLWNVTGEGEPEQVLGAVVNESFFPMLGIAPALGSAIGPANARQPVAVLSHGYWQRRFAGAPSVLGRSLRLSGVAHTIVGVMPPAFQLPSGRAFELWTPMDVALARAEAGRSLRVFRHVARLVPGVTLSRAQEEVDAVAARLAREHPDSNTGVRFVFRPLLETMVGDVRPALVAVLATVGLLLLITCANVANLLLARATARARDVAVRAALGAPRWRLVRELLAESFVLSICGGALGLMCAMWLIDALPALLTERLPRASTIRLDGVVLSFVAGVSLLVAFLFGLTPALHATAGPLMSAALREGGRAGESGRARRLRSLLVVVEVAVAVVVLTAAMLVGRSFLKLTAVDPGISTDRLLTFNVQFVALADDAARVEAARAVLERVRALPGVEAAGASSGLPLVTPQRVIRVQAQGTDDADPLNAYFMGTSPGYFRASGGRLVAGREFSDRDRAGGDPVVIINTALARRVFGDSHPIGRRIRFIDPSQSGEWRTIVGVVSGIRYQGLSETPVEAVYTPFAQTPFLWTYMMVRAAGEPQALVRSVRAAVADVNPALVAAGFSTLEDLLSDAVAQPRLNAVLIGSFALLGLALTLTGIYGVVAYTVVLRTREIGVRMALGAARRDVVRLVVGQGLRLTLIGISAGLGAAALATRLLQRLLFEVSPTDPAAFVSVAGVLVLAAIVASGVPARRATRVDPMTALRVE